MRKNNFKHNKRRNTAFLYECLIRQLTKYVLADNKKAQKITLSIIKEHFGNETVLGNELEIYQSLVNTKGLPKEFAEKLFYALKEQYKDSVDKEKAFEEQSKVISKINRLLTPEVFSNFVPNYKNLATINQIFSGKFKAKNRILLEEELIRNMTLAEEKKEEVEKVDNLVYKTFAEKFNKEYSSLLKEQVELLSKYITSFDDNSLELKMYLNEEIGRLKEEIKKSFEMKEIKEDQEMLNKTQRVYQVLEGYRETPINENMLEEVLKIQQLVEEIKKDDN